MKTRNFIIFFCFLVLSHLILKLIPKNYEYKYFLGEVEIVESYDKSDSIYKFEIDNKKSSFVYYVEENYISKRGLIKSVEIKGDCIIAISDDIKDISLCHNEEMYYTHYYEDTPEAKLIDTYNGINIYDFNNSKYMIWNYSGFLTISESEKDTIKLFNTDFYYLDLIIKMDDYLVVADYDQKYKFDKFYLINSKNNKVKEFTLDKELFFNSYILGNEKDNFYIYDVQQELEYKINPFKENVKKIDYETLVDGNWEKISINKLNKKDVVFRQKSNFYFFLDNNKLYYKAKDTTISVTNKDVDKIVSSNKEEVYFVSEGALYHIEFLSGIKKIMDYKEWNFNYNNIYVF